jgi:hypothetical protein
MAAACAFIPQPFRSWQQPHRIRRRACGRVQAEAAFFTVERFEARASAREDKAETCAAVVDVGYRCGGGVLHDARPRRICQRSSTSRARSSPSATQVCPPNSENRHRNSRCASVSRPPSDFNSNAKPSSRAQPQSGQAPVGRARVADGGDERSSWPPPQEVGNVGNAGAVAGWSPIGRGRVAGQGRPIERRPHRMRRLIVALDALCA